LHLNSKLLQFLEKNLSIGFKLHREICIFQYSYELHMGFGMLGLHRYMARNSFDGSFPSQLFNCLQNLHVSMETNLSHFSKYYIYTSIITNIFFINKFELFSPQNWGEKKTLVMTNFQLQICLVIGCIFQEMGT
jgi:hypothetical protein